MAFVWSGNFLEETRHRARDHELFVGADDPHADRAAGFGDERRISRVPGGVEPNAEEPEFIADSLPDDGRAFAHSAGEHERLDASEGRGEGADPFSCLIAKEVHGFRRPGIAALARKQVAHVRAGPGDPEKPRFVVCHVVKPGRAHSLGPGEEIGDPWVDVPGAGAHDQPCGRGEAHARVHAHAKPDGRDAGSVAEMGENDAALRRLGIQAPELLDQIGIGQAMEPVPFDPLRGIVSWNGKQPGHARHAPVKGGVEACDLGIPRVRRETVSMSPISSGRWSGSKGVMRRSSLMRGRRHPLGLRVLHSVDDPVPDRAHGGKDADFSKPIEEDLAADSWSRATAGQTCRLPLLVDSGKLRLPRSDAVDLSLSHPAQAATRLEDGETNARRAAIYCKNAGRLGIHRSGSATRPPTGGSSLLVDYRVCT